MDSQYSTIGPGINGKYSTTINGKSSCFSSGYRSFTPESDKRDEAFTYKPSPEAIKHQLLDELYQDLNSQCKRDLEFTAAKTEIEKINLLYQEMQSINKNLFNMQKLLIEKL